MSSTIYFLKRDKALGGVTNRDDKYQMLGYLESTATLDYFISAGICAEQVGDVVHYPENQDGLWLDSQETFEKFCAGSIVAEDITFLMTEDRKNCLLNRYDAWKQEFTELCKDPKVLKYSLEWMEYNYKKLVEFIEAVDFDRENMYFAYSY